MRRTITGVGGLLAVGAALAVAFAGSAHNGDGTPVTFGHSKTDIVQNADGSKDVNITTSAGPTVDLRGKTSLVATGTTTKFRVLGGQGVWNMKIWWDDLGAGASYKTTQVSWWNPGNHYAVIYWDHWRNQGSYGGETEIAGPGDTVFFTPDTTGTLTTKSEGGGARLVSDPGVVIKPSGCVYLIPTGGSETGTGCFG